MQTVSVTVLYKDNRIYDLTVNHNGQFKKLISYSIHNVDIIPHLHKSFHEMYYDVLCLLRHRGYKCKYVQIGKTRMYNIQWIDLDCPTVLKHSYIRERGEIIW